MKNKNLRRIRACAYPMKLFGMIAAIVVSLAVVCIAIFPKLTDATKVCRQTGVVLTLRTIHNAQAQFKALKGRFGTLQELAEVGLTAKAISTGTPFYGYIYSDANVSADTYCIRAKPTNDKVGTRDFSVIEDGEVRYHEAKIGSAVVCGEGISLTADSK